MTARNHSAFRSFSLASLFLALLSGCGKPDGPPIGYHEAYSLKVKDGHAVFKIGQLDIEFEGIHPKADFHGKGKLTVSVPGAKGGGFQSFIGADVEFNETMKDNVNSVSMNGFTFDLISSQHTSDQGVKSYLASQIKIGDETFSVDEPKTIYVLEDGTVSLTAAANRIKE